MTLMRCKMMMMICGFTLGLVFSCGPARADDKDMTVAQLQQLLLANAKKRDSNLADKIYKVRLSERLSQERLNAAMAKLPGKKSRDALTAVADMSQFLNLPEADQSRDGAPDAEAQKKTLRQMYEYAAHLIPTLPNIYARLTIRRYEDVPYDSLPDLGIVEQTVSLHLADLSTKNVVYRGGHEVLEQDAKTRSANEAGTGNLSTEGTFGPMLQTILNDLANGSVVWDHWEVHGQLRVAVFLYQVPANKSHYEIRVPPQNNPQPQRPAYHGELHLDAATGTILRLTMIAAFTAKDLCTRADMLVDYAPVEIGGKEFYCPIKGVAVSKVHRQITGMADSQGTGGKQSTWEETGPQQLRVNDMRFDNFHLFRADVEILPGN